eukprot:5477094-Pleurochrysis_carterae.AAC.1
MSVTDWEEMRADHALQCEENMARAEAMQAEARSMQARPEPAVDPNTMQSTADLKSSGAHAERTTAGAERTTHEYSSPK